MNKPTNHRSAAALTGSPRLAPLLANLVHPNREKRFKEYEERFGTDSAAYLIELEGSWLRNYTNACLILWEGWEDERELVRTAIAVADDAGLGYRELPETRPPSKPCSMAARTGASCASLPASRRISTVTEPLQPCG